MKKVFCILFLMTFAFASFSEEEAKSKEKTAGGSLGIRFSILGLEPTASIIFKKMEIEAFCPIISNDISVFDSSSGISKNKKAIGYMPGASFGYLSKPFQRGWQNGIGVLWYYVTPEYLESFTASPDTTVTGPSANAIAIYYKGGLRFNSGVNLYFRIMFPIALWAPETNETYTIIDREMSLVSALAMIVTPALGVRYTF